MPPRKHPSAGFWITVALVTVLVGYPLMYGPLARIDDHVPQSLRPALVVYWPLDWIYIRGPDQPLRRPLRWYVGLCL